ncbi:hypothetical protein DFH06DRAFT_1353834 [Mycena polygramma]|nr:hypothetical protein DFH06DRAFT_1353834 [Mycena polygramma]
MARIVDAPSAIKSSALNIQLKTRPRIEREIHPHLLHVAYHYPQLSFDFTGEIRAWSARGWQEQEGDGGDESAGRDAAVLSSRRESGMVGGTAAAAAENGPAAELRTALRVRLFIGPINVGPVSGFMVQPLQLQLWAWLCSAKWWHTTRSLRHGLHAFTAPRSSLGKMFPLTRLVPFEGVILGGGMANSQKERRRKKARV